MSDVRCAITAQTALGAAGWRSANPVVAIEDGPGAAHGDASTMKSDLHSDYIRIPIDNTFCGDENKLYLE